MRSLKEFSGNIIIFLSFLLFFKTVMGQNQVFVDIKKTSRANFTKLASNYGYKSKEYTVVTDDGYILSLFRILKGKKCLGSLRKPPILLMHGLQQCSDCWLDAGTSSLAFLISDACYDLWVGNVRGNYYGRRHVRLDPDTDPKFWEFTSEEMAVHDLSAIIDLMLNNTDSPEIIYIGYSQGGGLLFILCSETEYCNKIKFSIGLAPAARVKYTRSLPLNFMCESVAFLEPYLRHPRVMEISPIGGLIQSLGSYISKVPFFGELLANFILAVIDSSDPGSLTSKTLKLLFEHNPAGTSARSIAFFGQNKLSGRFQKYDYGSTKNMELYDSLSPPLYNLSRANMPVVLLYGNNDYIVDPRDTKWLSKQLPNVIETYEVPRPSWNHADMCYSQFIEEMIFYKIREYLTQYSDSA